ncbi:hypothetical protein HPB49_021727 [Dermacentor silvarum]|uniref:Uncharacterized protein n=1 Tax=Dermacentor silvarum TaxID=543639 RepID=A0ACB8E3E0_DERSI|nr:hypothetical protein HPB49_021727 [Dermacentor silvarum]
MPFLPSRRQALRMCHLLRTDTWRQIRLLMDVLLLSCSLCTNPGRLAHQFRQELKAVSQITDSLWMHLLPRIPKKPPAPLAESLYPVFRNQWYQMLRIDQGLDKGTIKFRRNDRSEPEVLRSNVAWGRRHLLYRLSVYTLGPLGDAVLLDSTGLRSITLGRNAETKVLTIEKEFKLPIIISANFLVTTPLSHETTEAVQS